MARNDTIEIPKGQWTQATNSDVTALRLQNLGASSVRVQATVGAVAPTSTSGSLELPGLSTIAADLSLFHLWPGVSSATRVWVYSDIGTSVSVSHA